MEPHTADESGSELQLLVVIDDYFKLLAGLPLYARTQTTQPADAHRNSVAASITK